MLLGESLIVKGSHVDAFQCKEVFSVRRWPNGRRVCRHDGSDHCRLHHDDYGHRKQRQYEVHRCQRRFDIACFQRVIRMPAVRPDTRLGRRAGLYLIPAILEFCRRGADHVYDFGRTRMGQHGPNGDRVRRRGDVLVELLCRSTIRGLIGSMETAFSQIHFGETHVDRFKKIGLISDRYASEPIAPGSGWRPLPP